MRTALRLLALLVGLAALPAIVALFGNAIGFTTLECVLAAVSSLPFSGVVIAISRASLTRARRVVAEVQAA